MYDNTNPPQSYWDEHQTVFTPLDETVTLNNERYYVTQDSKYELPVIMDDTGSGEDISKQLPNHILELLIDMAQTQQKNKL